MKQKNGLLLKEQFANKEFEIRLRPPNSDGDKLHMNEANKKMP